MGGSKINCMSSSEIPKVDPSDLLEATKQDLREARETVYELSAELGELRAQLDSAMDDYQQTRDENTAIVESFTWKLVQILISPKRILLRVLNIRGK
jgi:peptidoglycan hydrolase CwlO-like protein